MQNGNPIKIIVRCRQFYRENVDNIIEIYDELDVEMREAGLVMVRYADDAVVLCRTREEADAALTRMRAWVEANGLKLHPHKTHVGDCRIAGEGFEFLGYRFEAGQRWVRRKSLKALRDKIRGNRTFHAICHGVKEAINQCIGKAVQNPLLYFKHLATVLVISCFCHSNTYFQVFSG